MFIQTPIIDQNIIKIDNYKFVYKYKQHIIHQSHKSIKGINKTKRHNSHKPYLVLKAVFPLSPSFILI